MAVQIIAVANQKGGVGKTTTVINLAGALAERGKKILMVDIDPQASLGVGIGIDILKLDKTIYQVILNGEPAGNVIIPARERIDILPANIHLSVAELQLVGEVRREDRLKNALRPVQDNYDFILIDCPPSLGLLTINALSAATQTLIPLSCDYYSLVGVSLLLNSIAKMREQLNPNLAVLGILPTRYDSRTAHAKEVLASARSKLSPHYRVFETVVRETVRLKETPIVGMPITEYNSRHPAAEDYRNLAREVLNG